MAEQREPWGARAFTEEDALREAELAEARQRTPANLVVAARPIASFSQENATILGTTTYTRELSATGSDGFSALTHGHATIEPASRGAGFFDEPDEVGFVDSPYENEEPNHNKRGAAWAVGAIGLAVVGSIWGANSLQSPDKPAARNAELKVAPPPTAPGIELVQPDTGTPAPSPTDLPKNLVVPPSASASATKKTSAPSASAPRTTKPTPTGVPVAPVVPRPTSENTPTSFAPTETTTPTPEEAPEPSAHIIDALQRETDSSARKHAGEYASSRTLEQVLAHTGLSQQDILDWQQRYQTNDNDPSTTLETILGQDSSPITALTHFADRLQQNAVNSHDGSLFRIAWADSGNADRLSNRLNSGETLSFSESTDARLARVVTKKVNDHKQTFAAVVAEYPDQYGFTETRTSWYVVLAGATGESRLVLLDQQTQQSPYQPPVVEESPQPTQEPTPTNEPTTETPPIEVNSAAPYDDRSQDRQPNDRRPAWVGKDHDRSSR